ncbi:MAG: hypothetical protein Q7V40_13730 [Pseudolabrys sp.]|nr:hypothetical protein [Pseudolabrys sp.]
MLGADWPSLDLKDLGGRLDGVTFGSLVEEDIDPLSLALLALGENSLPPGIDWHGIATQLSLLYAFHLKPGGERRARMRAARANFYLRDRIDAEAPECPDLIDERRFPQPFVWDWLPLPEGELVADSSELNVSYRGRDGAAASARMGLPTQIDSLGSGRYSLSSCYSDGWYEWTGPDCHEFHGHPRPVVLVFAVHGGVHFLDRDGAIYRAGTGEKVARIGVEAVWRARLVGTNIYISDWGDPRVLTVVDTNTWSYDRIGTGPVLLTNDICKIGDRFYVIDKMQGRVFSFDDGFKPLDARMSFGKGRGELFDPITLRVHQGNLCVLSWLTGALATIRPF